MIDKFETSNNLVNMLQNLTKIIGKKMGVDLKMETVTYKTGQKAIDAVLKEMKSGRADLGYIFGLEYAEYKKAGGKDLAPFFTLGINNSTVMRVCMYTRKGEFHNVAELKGKRWGGKHYMIARYLLYKNNFNVPLEKFFGSLTYIPDTPISNLINALKAGKVDAISSYESVVKLSGELNKKDAGFEPLTCDDYESSWLFVARQGFPADKIQRIKEIVLNAHKDPDFASFKFAFQMVNGHFLPIDDKAMKQNQYLESLSSKGGWRKEDIAYLKKYGPLGK